MPGLSGQETAAVGASRPETRQLFASGYSEDLGSGGSDGRLPFVAKPYSAEDLLAAVREALAG